MKTQQIKKHALFQRSTVARVFGSQLSAPIIDLALKEILKERSCAVKWFIANGCGDDYDITLVVDRDIQLPEGKPYRRVSLAHCPSKIAVHRVREAIDGCLDDLAACQ